MLIQPAPNQVQYTEHGRLRIGTLIRRTQDGMWVEAESGVPRFVPEEAVFTERSAEDAALAAIWLALPDKERQHLNDSVYELESADYHFRKRLDNPDDGWNARHFEFCQRTE